MLKGRKIAKIAYLAVPSTNTVDFLIDEMNKSLKYGWQPYGEYRTVMNDGVEHLLWVVVKYE